jgi:hypothetical protein
VSRRSTTIYVERDTFSRGGRLVAQAMYAHGSQFRGVVAGWSSGYRIPYNVSMAQVTIYLPDDIEAQARKAARVRGTSLGRWIAEQVSEKVNNAWPPEVLAAIGKFPDFPDAGELRRGYGTDAPRESLD